MPWRLKETGVVDWGGGRGGWGEGERYWEVGLVGAEPKAAKGLFELFVRVISSVLDEGRSVEEEAYAYPNPVG